MINEEEIATYLGMKGYSIKKENISVEEQQLIRKELMVKPFVPKSSLLLSNHLFFSLLLIILNHILLPL